MEQIHKERLLKLADFLENVVTDDHFDLTLITTMSCKSTELAAKEADNLEKLAANMKHPCNSAACSIGWLPAAFPENFYWNPAYRCVTLKVDSNYPPMDFEAANSFFNLAEIQSDYLFVPQYNYSRRLQVVARIKEFVSEDGEVPEDYDYQESYEDDDDYDSVY